MKVLCTICARGGSKGVKNKNLKKFFGRPLIYHTISQAKKINRFTKIVCSSDSKNILNKRFDIIFMDPPFKESKINRLIENIIEKKILNKKGIIIIHRHKKDKLKITEKIKILDIRNYGISKVYFGN